MYKILQEIRDLLEDNLLSSFIAGAATTATNINLTAHGLIVGDNVINITRSSAVRRVIAVVDANNFTVESVTSQASGDTIYIPQYKKFYVGKVHKPPTNYLPILMVYGTTTDLTTKATNKDTYTFGLTIEIVTNAYQQIDATNDVENNNKELQAQKEIWEKMEARDVNGIPEADSILGVLRRNITGSNFLFNNDISISYETENTSGTINYRGILTLSLTTSLNYRQ
jgi:hypothetical protein